MNASQPSTLDQPLLVQRPRALRVLMLASTLTVCSAFAAPAITHAGQRHQNDVRAHGDDLEVRLDRQHHRIQKGIMRGDLTRREARKLLREHDRLRDLHGRLAYDGYLDRHEAVHLTRQLDKASARIYRKRHNVYERKPRYFHHYRGGDTAFGSKSHDHHYGYAVKPRPPRLHPRGHDYRPHYRHNPWRQRYGNQGSRHRYHAWRRADRRW